MTAWSAVSTLVVEFFHISGLYTSMLVFPSILGILVLGYGIMKLGGDNAVM